MRMHDGKIEPPGMLRVESGHRMSGGGWSAPNRAADDTGQNLIRSILVSVVLFEISGALVKVHAVDRSA